MASSSCWAPALGTVLLLCLGTADALMNGSIFHGLKMPPNGFGPYKIVYKTLENCEPTDGRKDASRYCQGKVSLYKASRTSEEIEGFVYIPVETPLSEGRLTAELWKGAGYETFYYSQFRNPCQHSVFSLIMDFMKPNKKCLILKGNYTITKMNPNKILHQVSDNFFYAKSRITMEWLSTVGTTCCFRGVTELVPLRTKKVQKPR